MGIYRGPGGSTDATRDATSEAVITIEAKDIAVAAAATAQSAASVATVESANAAASADAAAASAAEAAVSVGTIGDSVQDAIDAKEAAQLAQTNAETAQAAAEAAQLAAETAETNAEAFELSANEWATKTDAPVAGGEYSAKYNANLASDFADDASGFADAASDSADAASASATSASGFADAASNSADAAASVYDEFDDRYLGAKATAPTVDNDGNALLTGALYYNTTGTPQLYIWDGSAWDQAAFSVTGAVTSFNTRTGAVTLSSGDVTTALGFTPYDATNPSGYTTNIGTVTSVGGTAGTGISISGSPITGSGSLTITNTAPDQTVTLTASTGISTSGTYPDFTITNTAPDQTVALTAGTGISTSGTYPNFTVTNDAPDQTVVITAGTGISTSGTYPNFTVTNDAPMTYAGAGIAVSTGTAWGTSLTAPTGALVGTTDTQTLTNKTITGLKETRVAMGANDIDLSAGNYFTKTISGATTLTVSNVPTTGTAQSFILDLTNGGSAAITYFANVKFAGGTAPTLTAAGRDVLGFFTHDAGTTWTALVLGLDVK